MSDFISDYDEPAYQVVRTIEDSQVTTYNERFISQMDLILAWSNDRPKDSLNKTEIESSWEYTYHTLLLFCYVIKSSRFCEFWKKYMTIHFAYIFWKYLI